MNIIRICVVMITACLLLSSTAMAAKNKQLSKGRSLINLSLEEAGLEFQKLRKIKGHFSGGKWSDAVDKWMGRKHQLMLHLQKELTSSKADKGTINGVLGPPDYTLQTDDPQTPKFYLSTLSRELKQSGNIIFIYKWRGSHDFLYFVMKDERLVKSDWWMALE